MKQKPAISVLNSDLLQKGFKFWNSYKITLHEDKLHTIDSNYFGILNKEKTIDINNIDSISTKNGVDKVLLIVAIYCFLSFLMRLVLFSFIEANKSPWDEVINQGSTKSDNSTLMMLGTFLYLILGVIALIISFRNTQLIIKSHNDSVKIRMATTKREKINSFADEVLALKNKSYKNNQTNNNTIEIKDNLEFDEKIIRLDKLLKSGHINEEEYSKMKENILNNLF